jgi:DNA (cytosine-5)-methyltransferase 1
MAKRSWKTFKYIDLFAGIGGLRIPFDELGGKCVFSSEWDEKAQLTYAANFGETPEGDIQQVPVESISDHDILLAGFPCQSFSIIGKMRGFEESRGTLFFNIASILKAKMPPAFLLENVKQIRTHNRGKTYEVIERCLKDLGYHIHVAVLNALDYGLPQKRERTYIVGFRKNIEFSFPPASSERPSLSEFLEKDQDVDPKLIASSMIRQKRRTRLKTVPFYPSIWHENKSGNISVLPYSCALRRGASYNYLLVNGERRLSSKELLRLQGFPEDYKIVVPHSEIRKQTGNSVPVSVVRSVARNMINALRASKPAPIKSEQPSLPEYSE